MLNYNQFLKLLVDQYKPFPYEIDRSNHLYAINKYQNWATRQSKRFYHTYKTCFPYIKPGSTLLDIGAFPGSYLKIMRLIYGSDISLIAAGMPVEPDFPLDMQKLDIPFIPCDLDEAIPTNYPPIMAVADGSIDAVICTEMIEHMYTVKTLAKEIYRVLKPGGIVYISTNNVAYLPGIIHLLRGETNLDIDLNQTSAFCATEWRGHVRFYSLNQLETVIQLYNLCLVEKGYYQMRVPKLIINPSLQLRWWFSKLLDLVVHLLPLYRSHMFVLAQKQSITE